MNFLVSRVGTFGVIMRPLSLFDAWRAGRDRDALVYAVWLSLAAFGLLALVGAWSGRLTVTRGDRFS